MTESVQICSNPLPADLRRVRESLGISQSDLCDMIGVSHNTVPRWERGEMKPHRLFLRRWVEVLQAEIERREEQLDEPEGRAD